MRHLACLFAFVLGLINAPVRAESVSDPVKTLESDKKPLLPVEAIQRYTEAFTRLMQSHVDPVDAEALVDASIQGLMRSLGSNNDYLYGDAYRDLLATSKPPAGIGLSLENHIGFPRVVTPIDGSPSATAGIRPGEYLLRVDGESQEGLGLTDTVKRLHGAPGTKVTLTLRRPGELDQREVTLNRDIVKPPEAVVRVLEEDILYVRLSTLSLESTAQIRSALVALPKLQLHQWRGLILDLRNNQGGLLRAVPSLGSVLLPGKQMMVETRGRSLNESVKIWNTPEYFLSENSAPVKLPVDLSQLPLRILINHGTASGGEMLAAALHDHDRGRLVGRATAGNGLIYSVLPIRGGEHALKLATSRAYRPNGAPFEEGVQPSETLPEADNFEASRAPAVDLVVQQALRSLRSSAGQQ